MPNSKILGDLQMEKCRYLKPLRGLRFLNGQLDRLWQRGNQVLDLLVQICLWIDSTLALHPGQWRHLCLNIKSIALGKEVVWKLFVEKESFKKLSYNKKGLLIPGLHKKVI